VPIVISRGGPKLLPPAKIKRAESEREHPINWRVLSLSPINSATQTGALNLLNIEAVRALFGCGERAFKNYNGNIKSFRAHTPSLSILAFSILGE